MRSIKLAEPPMNKIPLLALGFFVLLPVRSSVAAESEPTGGKMTPAKFHKEVLQPLAMELLPKAKLFKPGQAEADAWDCEVCVARDKAREENPDLDWERSRSAIIAMRRFSAKYEPLRVRYEAGGAPAKPGEIALVRKEIAELLKDHLDITDDALLRTYLSRIAPMAAFDPKVKSAVIENLDALKEGKLKAYRGELQSAIDLLKTEQPDRAAARLQEIMDKAKSRGGAEAVAVGDVAMAGVRESLSPPRKGVTITEDYKRFKSLDNCAGRDCVPTPLSLAGADRAREHADAVSLERWTMVGTLVTGAGAVAAGIAGSPLIMGGLAACFIMGGAAWAFNRERRKGIEKAAEEKPSKD